jgi:hypothetical protein
MPKRSDDSCLLCDATGKVKKVIFYSGIMKGGTTHRLSRVTVTFFERWSDLTMHEIHVCRECQREVWKQKFKMSMILSGSAAAVLAVISVVGLIALPWPAGLIVGGVTAIALLGLAGVFAWNVSGFVVKKPKFDDVEPLIVQEAGRVLFPGERRSFLTTDEFIERQRDGAFG